MTRQAFTGARLLGQTVPVEAEILLCCARVCVDSQTVARCRRLLQEDVNWERLITLAQRHALTPLLYWQLRHFDNASVPVSHLTDLRNSFQQNAVRNLLLAQELVAIRRSFEARGIGSIPYKGPALAVLAYGNLSLRCFIDLDIIVRRKDVGVARSILSAGGYSPHLSLTESQQAAMIRTHHGMAFSHADKKIILELHWDVAGKRFSSQYDPEGVWRRLTTVRLGDSTLEIMSVEDTLLSLCVHGSRHLWGRLAWVCDVAELVAKHEQMDWERISAQAKMSGSWRMLAVGLLLALELFEAPLPLSIKEKVIADDTVRRLAARIAVDSFRESVRPPTLSHTFSYNLHVRERLSDRLAYFCFMLSPTDADLAAVSLPTGMGFLYYLLRPIRMIYRVGRASATH